MLNDAIQKDIIVVIMTQCSEGGVNDLYETGRALVEIGAVLAYDMTFECILAKLSYLLGKNYSTDKIKQMMKIKNKGFKCRFNNNSLKFKLTFLRRKMKLYK